MTNQRLWHRLDGDPFSYYLTTQGLPHFRIKLRYNPHRSGPPRIPEGQSVAAHVTSRMPELRMSDWWWVKHADGAIEVCIRMATVLTISG